MSKNNKQRTYARNRTKLSRRGFEKKSRKRFSFFGETYFMRFICFNLAKN